VYLTKAAPFSYLLSGETTALRHDDVEHFGCHPDERNRGIAMAPASRFRVITSSPNL
jgi:hypothetical protein